jgi:NitT/TauT family transport system substrate-binding protein
MMQPLSRGVFLGASTALALGTRASAQTAPIEVNYGILSPSASGWPLIIAESQGFYRDEGLKVTIVNSGSAPGVTNALATGALQMADNGTDSYIVAIAHGLPIKMIAPQCAINPYTLVVGPNITSWSDLKGKAIVLGTKQDVTAIVFAGMAAAQKLKLDDFSIVLAGASSARYAALSSGNVAGAILSQPFDLLAQSKGMRVLATAHETFKDWALACTAVNDNWAKSNRETVLKVLRAERRAIRFGYANRAPSIAALIEATHVDASIAGSAYDLLFGRWKAFDPNLHVNPGMLQTIGKSQIEMGIMTSMPPVASLYDPSFVREALK